MHVDCIHTSTGSAGCQVDPSLWYKYFYFLFYNINKKMHVDRSYNIWWSYIYIFMSEKVIIKAEGHLFVLSPFQGEYLVPAIILSFSKGLKWEWRKGSSTNLKWTLTSCSKKEYLFIYRWIEPPDLVQELLDFTHRISIICNDDGVVREDYNPSMHSQKEISLLSPFYRKLLLTSSSLLLCS